MSEEKPILLRQQVPLGSYKPRAYLNGFPKSGIHMVEQMVGYLLHPSEVGRNGSQWLGTYKWHSWSMIWQDMRQYLWRVSCLQRGHYLMGHSGFHPDIEKSLYFGNIGHIFLYRDLRDVAVSQTHHIMDPDRPYWEHYHKDLYEMLGSFEAALAAVIQGYGPYPGVVQRWAEYAPWIYENRDVLVLKYGDMLAKPEETAARIIVYLLRKATELLEGNNYSVDIAPEDLITLSKRMVEATKERSPTLRKGVTGSWRDEFTDEHVELFKKCDPDEWIVRLGFEDSPEWGNDRAGEGPSERDPVRDGGQ